MSKYAKCPLCDTYPTPFVNDDGTAILQCDGEWVSSNYHLASTWQERCKTYKLKSELDKSIKDCFTQLHTGDPSSVVGYELLNAAINNLINVIETQVVT